MFSQNSGAAAPIELIPAGTLAFGVVNVKDLAASKNTGGRYANVEITIASGPFANRKVFEMIADPMDAKNSEGWKQMAIRNLTRMFEACGVFKEGDAASYTQFNDKDFTAILAAIDGQTVAFKVKVEKGEDGYADKNKVAEFLSPAKASGSNGLFQRLVAQAESPAADPRKAAFAPVASQAPAGAPAWLK